MDSPNPFASIDALYFASVRVVACLRGRRAVAARVEPDSSSDFVERMTPSLGTLREALEAWCAADDGIEGVAALACIDAEDPIRVGAEPCLTAFRVARSLASGVELACRNRFDSWPADLDEASRLECCRMVRGDVLAVDVALLDEVSERLAVQTVKTKRFIVDSGIRAASPPKRKPGRSKGPWTDQRGAFAQEKVSEGLGWTEIAALYRDAHPEDAQAAADNIRLAYDRLQKRRNPT